MTLFRSACLALGLVSAASAACSSSQYETMTGECRALSPPCSATQWQVHAPSSHSDRQCQECGPAQSCADGSSYHACGGTNPGGCLPASCAGANTNCWVGGAHQLWSATRLNWSAGKLPTYPEVVQIDLSHPNAHAASDF